MLKHANKNIKLTLAYEGTHYLGWQKTHVGESVEGTLEKVLEQILGIPVTLQAASRTDAGVHAAGQVVNFFYPHEGVDLKKLCHGLNALLPKDIRVLQAEVKHETFHPTLDCTHKEYHYKICYAKAQYPHKRWRAWHYPFPLDLELMEKAAEYLIGTHDFKALCNERKNLNYKTTVRTLKAITFIKEPGQCLTIAITGDNFLYKMVRNIVGILAYVGSGKMKADAIPSLLASKKRSEGALTAPAHGLTLHHLYY